MNAAGEVMPSSIIFKGHQLQEDWINMEVGVPGTTYTVIDSSIMQGPVFLTCKKSHQWLRYTNKIDGNPHVILLDGHASHVIREIIKFALANNLVIFQLSSHALRITQPLNGCAFGALTRKSTKS